MGGLSIPNFIPILRLTGVAGLLAALCAYMYSCCRLFFNLGHCKADLSKASCKKMRPSPYSTCAKEFPTPGPKPSP